MLAPYAQEDHWVLFLVCPKLRTGYILDSKNKKQTKKERSYRLTSHLQDAVGSYTWTMVKCNQQQGNSECVYYVMRWMYDFANTDHFPATIPGTNRRQFASKEIDRAVEQ